MNNTLIKRNITEVVQKTPVMTFNPITSLVIFAIRITNIMQNTKWLLEKTTNKGTQADALKVN
jgi:hypothetical protein